MLIPSIWESSLDETSSGGRQGVVVTANSTIHTLGSYTVLIDPTSKPSYGVIVEFGEVRVANANTAMLVNIAYGPTGGGSEEIIIPNLNAGEAPTNNLPGKRAFHFPGLYVPSGVAVSAQCRALISSDTVRVAIWLGQDLSYDYVSTGRVQDYGTDTAISAGTSVVPGTNAYGTWTSIGTTVRDHRVWMVSLDLLADTSQLSSQLQFLIEIGIGPDSGNVTKIGGPFRVQASTGEDFAGPLPPFQYNAVPRGTELWARIGAGGTEARGIQIYGMD